MNAIVYAYLVVAHVQLINSALQRMVQPMLDSVMTVQIKPFQVTVTIMRKKLVFLHQLLGAIITIQMITIRKMQLMGMQQPFLLPKVATQMHIGKLNSQSHKAKQLVLQLPPELVNGHTQVTMQRYTLMNSCAEPCLAILQEKRTTLFNAQLNLLEIM